MRWYDMTKKECPVCIYIKDEVEEIIENSEEEKMEEVIEDDNEKFKIIDKNKIDLHLFSKIIKISSNEHYNKIYCASCSVKIDMKEDIYQLKCMHLFHKECILNMINPSKYLYITCPRCGDFPDVDEFKYCKKCKKWGHFDLSKK
jgi:hypothetical protein